jgi:hypothetical protein
MKTDITLGELLESIRGIIAEDLDAKPLRRGNAVADPALWRAIHNQQRSQGSVPMLIMGVDDSPSQDLN